MPTRPLSQALRASKRAFKKGLRVLGLEVHRIRPEPPSSPPPLFDDPLEALHYQRGGKDAAFACPLDRCVLFNGLSLAENGWNPFSATLGAYGGSPAASYEGSPLQAYYRAWQPRSALEAFIGPRDQAIPLAELPSHLLLWPWMSQTVEEIDAWARGWYYAEMAEHGFPEVDVEKHGSKLHGPTDPRVGTIEHKRFCSVYASLEEHGYDRQEGDVGVHLIRRGSEVRFLCRVGGHRVVAMHALGHKTVPARFSRQPRELDVEDVDYWPQVRRGVWSPEAARQYIDHLFDFDDAAWAKERGLLSERPRPDGSTGRPRASSRSPIPAA